MINREIKIFLTALSFFTRIPCLKYDFKQEYLEKSSRYFAIIGLIIGFINFLAFSIAHQYFPILPSIIFSLIISVISTGAFHEDGLADMADGLGGGWTVEKKLAIMKDSRIGTYGTVSLILLFGLKASLLYEALNILDKKLWLILFLSIHSFSRTAASSLMLFLPYVQDKEHSKSKPVVQLSKREFLFILISGGLPFYFLPQDFLLIIVPIVIFIGLMSLYLKRQIGGITGDCLGGCQQLNEIITIAAFYLVTCHLIV